MLQTFAITIEGYWREKNKSGVPNYGGIFFVYETKYNADVDTVTLLRILYVGEAENCRERIATHKLKDEWVTSIREGNELSYSAGYMEAANRTRLKAAFIYKCQPIVNTDFKKDFQFEQTTVICSGKTRLMEAIFTVG